MDAWEAYPTARVLGRYRKIQHGYTYGVAGVSYNANGFISNSNHKFA